GPVSGQGDWCQQTPKQIMVILLRNSAFIMLQCITADSIKDRAILLLVRGSANNPVGSMRIFITDRDSSSAGKIINIWEAQMMHCQPETGSVTKRDLLIGGLTDRGEACIMAKNVKGDIC
ncbi:MAG: hypothetical protein ACSW8H_07370, partial [bacterium]